MTGMEGQYRFLNRIWRMGYFLNQHKPEGQGSFVPSDGSVGEIRNEEIRRAVHYAIREITQDIDERRTLNTAIAKIMELFNVLAKFMADNVEQAVLSDLAKGYGVLLRLLSPFAPHIVEDCWVGLGNTESILKTPWPKHNQEFLKSETVTIVCSVNGKVRDNVEVPVNTADDDLKSICRTEKVEKFLEGKEVVKVVVVPGKLVNFVVK